MSKGSNRRPSYVTPDTLENNWERIFRPRVKCPECGSKDVWHSTTTYQNMEVDFDKCRECGHQFNIG